MPGSWAHSSPAGPPTMSRSGLPGSLPGSSQDLDKLSQSRARQVDPCQQQDIPLLCRISEVHGVAWSLPVFLCSILPWFWDCELMSSSPAFVKNKIITKRSAFYFRSSHRGNAGRGVRIPGSSPSSVHSGFETWDESLPLFMSAFSTHLS